MTGPKWKEQDVRRHDVANPNQVEAQITSSCCDQM